MASSWDLKGNVYSPHRFGIWGGRQLGLEVTRFAEGMMGEWGADAEGFRACHLFQIPQLQHRPAVAIEHYTREHDLVLRCEETSSQRLEALAVFRHCPRYAAMELSEQGSENSSAWFEYVLSIQTSQLDTAPISRIEFRLEHAAALQISNLGVRSETNKAEVKASPIPSSGEENTGYLLNDGQHLILIACHSSDLAKLQITSGENETEVQIQLRANQLEKGVIRRFRSLVAMGTAGDVLKMEQILTAFEKSSLPLSA
jgi:hypothetical protein